MNDKMLDMIGLADEKYLQEAEIKNTKTIKHRRRRFSAGMAAAVIAMSTVTVGAAVAYNTFVHKESVKNLGITEESNPELIIGTKSTENKHLRLTADTVLSDGYMVHIVFSLEALDDEGRAYMERENEVPMPTMFYSESKDLIYNIKTLRDDMNTKQLQMANYKGNFSSQTKKAQFNEDGSFSFTFSHFFGNDNPEKIYVVPEDYRASRTNEASVFDGMSLMLDVSKGLDVKEFSNGANKLYLSKIGITVIRGKGGEPLPSGNNGYNLILKDGSKENLLDNYGFAQGGGDHSFLISRKIIDINNVESVFYNGIEYKAE